MDNFTTAQLLVESSVVLSNSETNDHEHCLAARYGNQRRLVNRGILGPEGVGADDSGNILSKEIETQTERSARGGCCV